MEPSRDGRAINASASATTRNASAVVIASAETAAAWNSATGVSATATSTHARVGSLPDRERGDRDERREVGQPGEEHEHERGRTEQAPDADTDRARHVGDRGVHGRRGEVDEGRRSAGCRVAQVRPRSPGVAVAIQQADEQERVELVDETRGNVRAEVGRRIAGAVTALGEHVTVRQVPRAQEVHALVVTGERRQREREQQPEHARHRHERQMRFAVPARALQGREGTLSPCLEWFEAVRSS